MAAQVLRNLAALVRFALEGARIERHLTKTRAISPL
jgi:hypothetical protein